jgi:hypothetical protein
MSKELQLQNIKLELIQWLTSLKDAKTLERLLSIKQESQVDFWDELSDEEKAKIELGITQLDKGERISLEEFNKKIKGDV